MPLLPQTPCESSRRWTLLERAWRCRFCLLNFLISVLLPDYDGSPAPPPASHTVKTVPAGLRGG